MSLRGGKEVIWKRRWCGSWFRGLKVSISALTKCSEARAFFLHRPIGDSPFVKISNLISNSILASLRHIRHIHILVSSPTNKNHEDYHIICFQESKLSASQILVFQWDFLAKQQERHVVFGGCKHANIPQVYKCIKKYTYTQAADAEPEERSRCREIQLVWRGVFVGKTGVWEEDNFWMVFWGKGTHI